MTMWLDRPRDEDDFDELDGFEDYERDGDDLDDDDFGDDDDDYETDDDDLDDDGPDDDEDVER
jgi:hypothetical protein